MPELDKKYRLTNNTIEYNRQTLYQIEALKDFRDVKNGDLGGYIADESCLSHDDICWVFNDSKVTQGSVITGEAEVHNSIINHSRLCDNVIVKDSIIENSVLCENVFISDKSVIVLSELSGTLYISEESTIKFSKLRGRSQILHSVVNMHNVATIALPKVKIYNQTIGNNRSFIIFNSDLFPLIYNSINNIWSFNNHSINENDLKEKAKRDLSPIEESILDCINITKLIYKN